MLSPAAVEVRVLNLLPSLFLWKVPVRTVLKTAMPPVRKMAACVSQQLWCLWNWWRMSGS